MKLMYHIEDRFASAWNPVKVRIDGAHNFAAFVEWHESLDDAIKYAQREFDHAKRVSPYRAARLRVTDHLGNVHWPNPTRTS
jgi:hypothetical protein